MQRSDLGVGVLELVAEGQQEALSGRDEVVLELQLEGGELWMLCDERLDPDLRPAQVLGEGLPEGLE